MKDQEVLLSMGSLQMVYETGAANDVKNAIRNTILGNPNGIRYRQLDALNKIEEIDPLHFFPIRRNRELLYLMALAERHTENRGESILTFYVRYVSFNPRFALKNIAGEAQGKLQRIGNSMMKEGMKKLADSFCGTSGSSADADNSIYYAYVEDSNLRSLNFTKFFFEPIREFSVFSFSRFFPQDHPAVSKLTSDETGYMVHILKEQYKDYSFYFLDESRLRNRYFVYRDSGRIVAGLRAYTVNWQIENLPGVTGKLILSLLPYLPFIRRIFNKKRFSFLSFDCIYCEAGYEKFLPALFSAVCSAKDRYAAMIYLDSKDHYSEVIQGIRDLGLLNRLFGKAQGKVLARFTNLSEEEKEPFFNRPVFVSAYDLT